MGLPESCQNYGSVTMSSAESLRARGTALAEEGRFEQAIELFRRAVEIDAADPVTFELLAQCLLEVGSDSDAYVAAGRAVDLDPGWPEGYLTLGRAARNCGYLQASIVAFQFCIDKGGDASVWEELEEVESLCSASVSSKVGLPSLVIKQNFGDGSGPGCVVWECGLLLAWHLTNHVKKGLKGKRVLELGSGTGIGAITAALLGADALATDISDALPLLSKNIDLNVNKIRECNGCCRSSELDWYSLPPNWPQAPCSSFDLIIGADLVYSDSQIPGLCMVLGKLASCSKPGIEFLLVHKTRDASVDRDLFDGCQSAGVDFTKVNIDTSEYGSEQELQSIHLYRASNTIASRSHEHHSKPC